MTFGLETPLTELLRAWQTENIWGTWLRQTRNSLRYCVGPLCKHANDTDISRERAGGEGRSGSSIFTFTLLTSMSLLRGTWILC